MSRAFAVTALVLCSAFFSHPQASARLGSSLTPGMQLLYESNGVTTPWFIDSVNKSFVVGDRSDCLRIVLRIGTGQPQVRTHCVVGDTMMNWSATTSRLVPARRLSTGVLNVPGSNRALVQFRSSDAETATVGDQQFMALPTVITTYDSASKVIRRLTERFAPEIATATEGVIEVPDSVNTDQWRVVQRFRLTAIRRP